jgi:glycosyltransferase involved in cell wall biosynthesis
LSGSAGRPPNFMAEERTAAAAHLSVGDPRWRAHAESVQESALPDGRVVVSCPAPPGTGGLGRHLEEIADALERRGSESVCICATDRPSGAPSRRRLRARAQNALLSLPPLRLAAAQRALQLSVEFDVDAAARLGRAEHLIAFNGVALEQIGAARRAGYESASIVSATAHIRRVMRQYDRAYREYALEGSWAARLVKRTLLEYSLADRIYVSSEYVRESFLEEGFAAETLSTFPLTPSPRFVPAEAPAASSTFDIVYVGGLSVVKGVPLLIDAVRALAHADIRLHLVGGWSSRGMRRFIERASAEDPRIRAIQGDPLSHLRAARLYVHPSYSDGFGYAAVEALACGVPVIVSEDTGMKDVIDARGGSGAVVATGRRDALTGAIEAAYRGELFGARATAPTASGESPTGGPQAR